MASIVALLMIKALVRVGWPVDRASGRLAQRHRATSTTATLFTPLQAR
jgi:hypothetical protein